MISTLKVTNVILERVGKITGFIVCKMKNYYGESGRKGRSYTKMKES